MSSEIPSLISQLNLPQDLYAQSQSLNSRFTTLMQQLRSVSDTISSISGPVNLLEIQRHNARTALRYVDDIILYSTKLKELSAAAKFDNIPYAASLCSEISKIPVHIPLQETIEFHRLKDEISDKVKKRFGEALSDNNKESIEQYAALFQHLDLGREGIERYIGYIIESVKAQIHGVEQLLGNGASYEDTLVKIFRITVRTFDEQQENISKEFGVEGSTELLQSLQGLVDGHAVHIIDKYCIDVASKTKSQALCEEISKIIKHSESFETYLNKLGRALIEKNTAELPRDGKFSRDTGLLKMSEIKSKILELADTYISLESQLMQNSVSALLARISVTQYAEKNCSSKEVLNTGQIFEALDECFFLVQNAENRGLSTLNINSICAILNNISAVIAEELIEMIAKKIPAGKIPWSSQFTSSVASMITVLNMLVTCKKCIKKFATNLDMQFSKIFGGTGSDIVMFKHCLAAISESETRITGIIDEVIANSTKSFQITQLLGGFRAINYDITLEMHSDYEVNDPFALKLVKDIKALLKQWRLQLIPELFENLIEVLAEELSKGLEVEVRNKRFNELGALQLQKDVREIVGQMQHMSNRPLRHRFAKLRQISELLLARDEQEILGLIKDSEWKLTDRETQGFRRLRIL